MNKNAVRMQAVIAFVADHPGWSEHSTILYVLSKLEKRGSDRAFKQAAAVVTRVLRDRLVRRTEDARLYPWDTARKRYAEALETAANVAPPEERSRVSTMAARAWRAAGDEERAELLERLDSLKRVS